MTEAAAGTPTTPAPAAPAAGASPEAAPAAGAGAAPAGAPAKSEGTPAKAEGASAEGAKPGEAKATEDPNKGAPSKAAATELKLPEGGILDAKDLDRVKTLATEKKLSLEQAQGILDAEAQGALNFKSRQTEQVKKTIEGWKEASAKNPEIAGKDGKMLAENLEGIRRAFQKVGGDQFMKLLDETGFGHNEQVLLFGKRLYEMTKEDSHVPGASPTGPTLKSTAEVMFAKSAAATTASAGKTS